MTTGTRLLLVLPVLLGLLGMHALAAPPAAEPLAAGLPPAHAGAASPGPAGTGHGQHEGHRDHGDRGGHGDHGDHGAASHLLHLCLAVLVAGVALVAALLLTTVRPPWPGRTASPGRGSRAPAARPPPVGRRLAQLCVLRN
ncbi:DUF6153 family protein [Pseudonocardia spirodelae]|uniref:DUF6153 family protein n=1 Tax=Pseudonocardia spirodelae TaxID=3133431 RepID=A0ABU8T306_9PSEU